MGKQLLTLIFLTFFVHNIINAQSYVNINIDKKTIEQVATNTGVQTATNTLHNNQIDSIKKKQSKLLTLVTGIAAEKELLIQTYQNVSGFKQESKYYQMITATGMDIINHSSQAIEEINKSKLTGKVTAIMNVSGLVSKAIGLGKAFADIVANSEVPNPIKHPDATSGDKDKYNLLNRHERISMANDILMRLRTIDRSICYLIWLSRTSTLTDIIRNIDRESYINYIMMNVNTNEIIRKWEKVKK